MRNLTKGKDHHTGMALVTWYLDFLQKAQPDTWTFENVRSPAIREHLQERGVAHGYFDFVKYGVPQTRKRCLAGSASIIDAFRNNTSLRATPARTPRDVLDPPHDAAYIRASAGKNTEYFNRSLDEPTWALLCTAKPTYTRHNQSCVRVLSMRELLSLQTFPDSYRMKSSGHLGSLASEMDRVRLVGNAVPPLVAEKLMAAVH
jgi:site-specific DNA-cytosine methylase